MRTPDNCGYRATFDINGVYIYIYIYAWNRFVTHSSDSLERLSRSSDANNPCTLNVMNTGIIERVWIYLAGCYLPMRTFDFCGSLTHRMSHKFPRFPNVFPISFPFRVVTACRYYYLGKRSKKKKKMINLNDAFSSFLNDRTFIICIVFKTRRFFVKIEVKVEI